MPPGGIGELVAGPVDQSGRLGAPRVTRAVGPSDGYERTVRCSGGNSSPESRARPEAHINDAESSATSVMARLEMVGPADTSGPTGSDLGSRIVKRCTIQDLTPAVQCTLRTFLFRKSMSTYWPRLYGFVK